MKYIVYTIMSVIYLSALLLICFVWSWEGWLSVVEHILSIVMATIAFIVFLMILTWHYYGKILRQASRDFLSLFKVTFQAMFEMTLNPFWWYNSGRDKKFQNRFCELIDS